MSKLHSEIVELAKLDNSILDDLVHTVVSQKASDINNQGIEEQIDFLSENGFSLEELKDFLEQS